MKISIYLIKFLLVICTLGDPSVAGYIDTLQAIDNLNITQPSSLVNKLVGSSQDKLGYASKIIGDCNGDGIDDVAVNARLGTPLGASGRQYAGIVYIIYGASSGIGNFNFATTPAIPFTQGFRIFGSAAHDFTGNSLSSADVNGDGLQDIIIGSESSNANTGTVYVVYGQRQRTSNVDLSSFSNAIGFAVKGVTVNDMLGNAVAGLGDINGDGYEDFILGASGATAKGRVGAGISYVLLGRSAKFTTINLASPPSGLNYFQIYGAAANDHGGIVVSSAGDINHDGLKDMIVGAPSGNNAYVIYGRRNTTFADVDLSVMPNTIGFRMIGEVLGDYFGGSVTSIGDFNGDGVSDIAISARIANYDDTRLGHTGKVYILYGRKNTLFTDLSMSLLSWTDGLIIVGANSEDYTGAAIASAGDINGDGYDDLVIGAPEHASRSGLGYVVYGCPITTGVKVFSLSDLSDTTGYFLYGLGANAYLGYSVGGGGDINSDGYDDILIGAPTSAYLPGAAYVIYGSGMSIPSRQPTSRPSKKPSVRPTTSMPSTTSRPSVEPTTSPSNIPSYSPSNIPTILPSWTPTTIPSLTPSAIPSLTTAPSTAPTLSPTSTPTTPSPTILPSIFYPTQGPISLTNVIQFNVYFNITYVLLSNELQFASKYVINHALSTLLSIDSNHIQIVNVQDSSPMIITSSGSMMVSKQLSPTLRRDEPLVQSDATQYYYWVIPVVQITLSMTNYPEFHSNGTLLYQSMQQSIEEMVFSGTFTSTIRKDAQDVPAPQLQSSAIVSVEFGNYSSTIDSTSSSSIDTSSKAGLTTNLLILLIVFVICIAFCLCGACGAYYYYYLYTQDDDENEKQKQKVQGTGSKDTIEEGQYPSGLSAIQLEIISNRQGGGTTAITSRSTRGRDLDSSNHSRGTTLSKNASVKATYKGIDSNIHVADILYDHAEVLFVPPATYQQDMMMTGGGGSPPTTMSTTTTSVPFDETHFHTIPCLMDEGGSSHHDSSYHSHSTSRHSSPRFFYNNHNHHNNNSNKLGRSDSQSQSFYGQMTQYDDDGINEDYYQGETAEAR